MGNTSPDLERLACLLAEGYKGLAVAKCHYSKEGLKVITIKGNTAVNCGTLLKMNVPHTANVVIEDNHGFNISGELINATVFVDPEKLNSFLAEVKPHMQDLQGEQLSAFQAIVENFASSDIQDKSDALSK